MAPGFAAHPGQTELATSLARITFPYLILTVVAVQLSAMLNAHEKFAAAAAWSIFLNVAIALSVAPSARKASMSRSPSRNVNLANPAKQHRLPPLLKSARNFNQLSFT